MTQFQITLNTELLHQLFFGDFSNIFRLRGPDW